MDAADGADKQSKRAEGGIAETGSSQKITRRQALSTVGKVGIGVVAAAVIAGGGYYAYTASQPAAKPSGGTINLFTYSPLYAPTGYMSYLQTTFDITLTASLGSAATLGDQIISSVGSGWDTSIFWGAFGKPIINASPAVLQGYDLSAVPKWTSSNLDPLFVNPQNMIGQTMGTQMQNDMWWPGKIGTTFAAMPPMYGVDSFAQNAQMIDHLLTSWGDLMDRQWVGKVAVQDIPTVALNNFALLPHKIEPDDRAGTDR